LKEIDARQLAERLQQSADAPMLIDVREAWEWEIARMEGAVHVPMGSVPGRIDAFDRQRPVVVMCHHGSRSRQVALWLEAQGFVDVSNFDGGIDAWSAQIDPNVPRY
jgi:rhodanese-related sulfurtransferase